MQELYKRAQGVLVAGKGDMIQITPEMTKYKRDEAELIALMSQLRNIRSCCDETKSVSTTHEAAWNKIDEAMYKLPEEIPLPQLRTALSNIRDILTRLDKLKETHWYGGYGDVSLGGDYRKMLEEFDKYSAFYSDPIAAVRKQLQQTGTTKLNVPVGVDKFAVRDVAYRNRLLDRPAQLKEVHKR